MRVEGCFLRAVAFPGARTGTKAPLCSPLQLNRKIDVYH